MQKKRALVVVLGDIGRSPRMSYHALSLAKANFSVDIVGYGGSSLHSDLALSPDIHLHYLKEPPNFYACCPRIISYVLKTIWQAFTLFVTLLWISKPEFILVQNPPAIPTLPVCWLLSWLRGINFIVDWHNYGFTILALSLKSTHFLVSASKFVEKCVGRFSSSSFCVSEAMRKDLLENWSIRATTLYDRPAEKFRPISLQEKHELLLKLANTYNEFSSSRPDDTLLTERFADGEVRLREDRPGLLISSTSWTEDEDFKILLDALDDYERERSANAARYPKLLCVITGKGPLKSFYLDQIKEKQWQHIEVCAPWLDPEDYPKLIASGDLGVCLHTSSSGLDLPMKILDMFGSGLPVCAIHYNCIDELVQTGINGMTFKTARELANQLLSWFADFPHNNHCHDTFRKNLEEFQNIRWHEQWLRIALPQISPSPDSQNKE